MNIFLIGYMASGKTTVGTALAKKLNFRFIDLDHYIENKEDMMVSEIFSLKGEIYFRKLESKYLEELINSDIKTVISLGGGTPCYGNNLQLILDADNTLSIYLKASLNELTKRLLKDKDKRPLIAHLNSEPELLEFVGKHLFERSNYYNQANKTVIVDKKSIEDVVEEIILTLF